MTSEDCVHGSDLTFHINPLSYDLDFGYVCHAYASVVTKIACLLILHSVSSNLQEISTPYICPLICHCPGIWEHFLSLCAHGQQLPLSICIQEK